MCTTHIWSRNPQAARGILVVEPVPGGTADQQGGHMPVSRRNVLKLAGLGAGATIAGFSLPLGQSVSTADWISTSAKPKRFARPLYVPQPITPQVLSDGFGEYLFYEVHERAAQAQILDPGAPTTTVLGYANGSGPVTVPGPLVKVDQNTRVRMR